MTIECDLTNDTELSVQDKIEHLQRAEAYEKNAKDYADSSRRDDAAAQVKLEQSFVRGRKAEIEEERGTDAREVRRIKDTAVEDMNNAIFELQRFNPRKSREYDLRASEWRKRLSKDNVC